MKRGIACALAAGILPLLGVAASAQPVSQPGFPKEDLAAFRGNLDSLAHAVRAIERMTGGRVAEIRFTNADGKPGYHAVVAKGGRALFMLLREKSGNLSPALYKSWPAWMLQWRGQINIRFVESAKISLPKAIIIAEATDDNQPAVAAGIARNAANPDSDVHAYNVLIDHYGTVQRVAVDVMTANIVAAPGVLADWP